LAKETVKQIAVAIDNKGIEKYIFKIYRHLYRHALNATTFFQQKTG
jgi:hypothetical protein